MVTVSNSIISEVISKQDVTTIVNFFVEFGLIYICCILGTLIKDAWYASKNKLKIDFKSILVYNIPCSFLLSAAYDLYSGDLIKFSGWACISFITGIWSREIISILFNTKCFTAITKMLMNKAISKIGKKHDLSDDEKEELANVFKDAVKDAIEKDDDSSVLIDSPEDELSDENPVGEFKWTDILEY